MWENRNHKYSEYRHLSHSVNLQTFLKIKFFNLLLFFSHICVVFKAIPCGSPKALSLNQNYPSKTLAFQKKISWNARVAKLFSNDHIYKQMLESPNFGRMTALTI